MDRQNGALEPTVVVGPDRAVTPPAVDADRHRNVTDLLANRLRQAPEHIAFETPATGSSGDRHWIPITTREFANRVADLAKGLIATGTRAAETVMIMAPTQYMWAVIDQAALFAGAVVVPVYDTSHVSALAAIFADSHPRVAFVESSEHAERVRDAATAAGTTVPSIWILNEAGSSSLDALVSRGEAVSDAQLEERRTHARLDDLATIVYTSGTTGAPKGVQITHRNLVGQVLNTAAAYSEVVHDGGNTVLFLPLTHVLGRALQLICISNGMKVAHLSDPKEVIGALPVLKPTFLVVVPRVLEKIEAAATASAQQKHLLPLWRSAERTAIAWARTNERGARISMALRIRHALADRLFFRRLRAVMGGRLEYFLSGAATLRPELALLFGGMGVPVIEGYGLTETTAPLTGGRPGALIAGTVGTPLPGNEVRIADNGEILARGVGVFSGYHDDEQNAEAFTDGYFRTGDLGTIDARGALTLTGRLKDVIVTSTGRTVSPGRWEQQVEEHPLVAHAVAAGNDRPFITALVVVDTDAARAWFGSRGERAPEVLDARHLSELRDPRVIDDIASAISNANSSAPVAERVTAWVAVVIGSEESADYITPTMKLKRQAILAAAAPLVDELYP